MNNITPQITWPKQRLFSINFFMLFLGTFLLFTSLETLLPTLPLYILHLEGTEVMVGTMMGIFTFSSVLLRPYQGREADRRGRKKILIASIILFAAAAFLYIAAGNLYTLMSLRFLHGIGLGGILISTHTLAVDLAPPSRRGEALGYFSIAPPLAMSIGPLAGEALLSSYNFTALFLASGTLALLGLAASLLIKEPVQKQKFPHSGTIFSRKVALPALALFFITVTFGAIVTYLPLFGESRGLPGISLFFTLYAAVTIAFHPLAGRLSDIYGRRTVLIPGAFLLLSSLVLLAFTDSLPRLLAAAFLYGAGFSFVYPPLTALAADLLDLNERGTGMATFTAAFDLGVGTGAIFLGFILRMAGFTTMYLLSAASVVAALTVFFRADKQ